MYRLLILQLSIKKRKEKKNVFFISLKEQVFYNPPKRGGVGWLSKERRLPSYKTTLEGIRAEEEEEDNRSISLLATKNR